MSEAIAKSPEANVFVACEASAGEKWLREAEEGQVRTLFSDFISKFKHRCLREVRNRRGKKTLEISLGEFPVFLGFLYLFYCFHKYLMTETNLITTINISVRSLGRSLGR